jgi:hypothetical protein
MCEIPTQDNFTKGCRGVPNISTVWLKSQTLRFLYLQKPLSLTADLSAIVPLVIFPTGQVLLAVTNDGGVRFLGILCIKFRKSTLHIDILGLYVALQFIKVSIDSSSSRKPLSLFC